MYHVPEALSRAFESDPRDDKNISVSLVAVADAKTPDDTGNLWYRKRFREISKRPKLFAD